MITRSSISRCVAGLAYLAGLALVTFSFGCQSEEEKAREAVLNFTVADRVHAAPFRSYLFISSRDKDAMSLDEYAEWHDYPERPSETVVEVTELNLAETEGSAQARIGEETFLLSLVLDDDRWRVRLGLHEAEEVSRLLSDAEAARRSGELSRALEFVDRAQAIPFEGSLANEVDTRLGELKSELEAAQRRERLESGLQAAATAELDALRKELPQLARLAAEMNTNDVEIAALRDRLATLRGDAALEGLRLAESKVRRFYEGKEIAYELDLTVANDSQVTVTGATLSLEMMQGDETLGSRSIPLVFDDPLSPGSSKELSVPIPDGPTDWKSRDFNWEFAEVEIFDE